MEPRFLTIRETAKTGILPESFLRTMEKQGRLPGIYSGNRFLVNYPLLLEQLDRESLTKTKGRTNC
ncbi:MAG: hypothetical protein LUG17_00825 [Clostridiales bacterium]|nr:hypothetical protein [Clostridiales bacterium]